MKILLAVPTRNRSKTFVRQTYSWAKDLSIDVRVFLEEEQRPAYTYVPDEQIVLLPEAGRGLGYALANIKQYAVKYGYDLVFKVDDDIKTWRYQNRTRSKNVADTVQIVEKVLVNAKAAFSQFPKLGGISFAYGFEMWDVKNWTGLNMRMQSVYLVKPSLWFPREDVTTFEDFYTTLNILDRGYDILRYGLSAIDGPMPGENKGGIQDFNRLEMAKKEFNLLRNLFDKNAKFQLKPDTPWQIEPLLKSFKQYNPKKL